MSVIACRHCGQEVNEAVARCPGCGADPRSGEGAIPDEALSGARGATPLGESCSGCGKRLMSHGVVKLRTGGTTGGWIFLFSSWAELDEGVLPLEMIVCEGCRRVTFRIPDAPG